MNRFARSLAVTVAAACALFAAAGTATATEPPVSGDDRATAHEGNKTGRHCPELFPGSTAVSPADLTHSADDTYLDITAIADGVEVVGVIVKGGPAYNVYKAGDLGDLPWLDLHSPLVPSGKPAQISHWFACGVKDVGTTSKPTSTKPTTPTSTTPPTSSSSTEQPTSSTPVTTTTTDAAGVGDEDLADTGFNGGWLVLLGAVLLLAGGAVLILLRIRGARR